MNRWKLDIRWLTHVPEVAYEDLWTDGQDKKDLIHEAESMD